MPSSLGIVNQTASIPRAPEPKTFLRKQFIEYNLPSSAQTQSLDHAVAMRDSRAVADTKEREKLAIKQPEQKTTEEDRTKLILRIAKQRSVDVQSLQGPEFCTA